MSFWVPWRVAGVVLLTAGVGVLIHAFVRFVVEGVGTPAPVALTERLVVGGYNAYRQAVAATAPAPGIRKIIREGVRPRLESVTASVAN